MATHRTTEEYKEKLNSINPNLELLSEYINSRTKITIKDKRCGHIWDVNPSTPLRGHGCPKCAGVKKKTHDEFVSEIKIINPNVEILSKYKGTSNPIECKCAICNYKWTTTPNNLLNGKSCGKCKGMHLTNQEFQSLLQKKHPHISLYADYRGSHKNTLFICIIDGYIWEEAPHNIIRTKNGCPICMSKAQSNRQLWSNSKYISELKKTCNYIFPLSQYKGWNIPIKHKCSKCGYEWDISPTSILHNPHCPSCDGSTGERKIVEILEKYKVPYECQKKYDDLKQIKHLRYDFFLPTFNTLIEYDGQFHYEPIISSEKLKQCQIRDQLKNEYAEKNHITLIRIPYWDFDNIETILKTHIGIGG